MTRPLQSRALTTLIFTIFVQCLTFTTVSRAETVPDSTSSRFVAELEAGPAWQSRNDVQIPNNQPAVLLQNAIRARIRVRSIRITCW